MGHGHVVPNPDGSKARCGGPVLCAECAREQATHNAQLRRQPKLLSKWDAGNVLVNAADKLSDCASDLEAFPDLKEVLLAARRLIAEKFNAEMVHEMGFGI
jgi:hypothetical protein